MELIVCTYQFRRTSPFFCFSFTPYAASGNFSLLCYQFIKTFLIWLYTKCPFYF